VYPAWFANPELASWFTPPEAISPTGAAILARLRRDGYDWRERLRTISAPILVLHGEEDPLPSLPMADFRTESYIGSASAHVVVLPASGHMPFWESPQRSFSLIESIL
jgi:pimeloyl-ACP methyl ester carboxylesterase